MRVVAVVLALVCAAEANGEPAPQFRGFLDFNAHYDTRGFSSTTTNVLAQLPGRFQYFSLSNYYNPKDADRLDDLDAWYSEQNLRWSPHKGVPADLSLQWVNRTGERNDLLRLGVRWRLSGTQGLKPSFDAVHLFFSVSLHALEFTFLEGGYTGQIEHVYCLTPWSDALDQRIYIAGFIDHNVWLSGPEGSRTHTVVTEHQLGLRAVNQLFVVGELRYNGFLVEEQVGVGFGLEYKIPFLVVGS